MDNRIQHCTNCGICGHIFRNCLSPITSYGIIAVRYLNDNDTSLFSKTSSINNGNESLRFLLIKRKDSLSFVEFTRGKYNPLDNEYIGRLFRGMTQKEHDLILSKSFDEIWCNVWGETSSLKTHKNDYDVSENKYNLIKDKIAEIIKNNPTKWTEPEWGFPKGRRNPHETDMNCAIREFQEETGIKRSEFTIIQNTFPISETFFGSNQVHYCHKYYIAICNKSVEAKMNIDNHYMIKEIGDIQWCSLDEATSKIRPDNVEKREILLKAGKIMRNFYPIYTSDIPR